MKQELEQLFLQREKVRLDAKNFLDCNSVNGKISREEAKEFEKYEKEMKNLSQQIESELSKSTTKPILNNPQDNYFSLAEKSQNEYRKNFVAELRNGFKTAKNYLQESLSDAGGYIVPQEMHDELVSELKEQNVLRQICRIVKTQNNRRVAYVSNAAQASFVAEGATIPLQTETFGQKILSAHKLVCGVSVTNELLNDSYFDVEQHLKEEFAMSIGSAEEQAFLIGDGVNRPLGLLSQINSESLVTTSTAGTLKPDDLVQVVYSLPFTYRKNACFLASDMTLAEIHKFKDNNLNYLWQPSFQAGVPDRLLGYPVFSSNYMPSISTGEIPLLFGDFSKVLIGERGEFVVKPLYELHALSDLTTFLGIQRTDCILADSHALRGLKIK